MKRSTFLRGLGSLPLLAPLAAAAQSFPTRPVTIVVPYATGGPTDTAARLIGDELARRTGQAFIIQNRPGASTIVGTEAVKSAAPDGYTWLLATTSTFSLNPVLYKDLRYRRDDFEAVGAVAKVPYAVVLSTKVPATSMPAFVQWARSASKPFTYGTVGQGTPPHVLGVSLSRALGAKSLAVHYKGSSPVQVDLLAGVIDMSIDPLTTALPMHKAGKVRIVAVVDDTRWPALADVPTLGELGITAVRGNSWLGLFVPAGAPGAVVASMGEALAAITASKDVQDRFAGLGLTPLNMPQQDFRRFIDQDAAWWKKTVQENRIRLES